MPLQQTSGNDTTDAYGGGAAVVANYIEDVFSTWLYDGTGAAQTITNNIDLSGKGGLTWIKSRSAATDHKLTDTIRGATKALISDTTGGQTTDSTGLTAFGSTGFTIGADANYNTIAETYVSWTFRKQPKFFDVVTYTGTGSNRTIAHSLGSVPGCIIVKRTDTTGAWQVYHSSLANTEYLVLNTTAAKATGATRWNSTTPTSSVFSIGTDATVNASGGTYVAYIYASNAGGFGLTGTNNVISCGSFTTDASGNGSVNLGYEPQWVLIKEANGVADWWLMDNMRGFSPTKGTTKLLNPDTSSAEITSSASFYSAYPTATGFVTDAYLTNSNKNVIYIAIRRGPMKVPTLGTSVFSPTYLAGDNTTGRAVSAGFAPDLAIFKRVTTGDPAAWTDKLRGTKVQLNSTSTAAEVDQGVQPALASFSNTGLVVNNYGTNINTNATGFSYAYYSLQRASGFFDEVCYTGTGANATQTHNLQAVPEMMIVKKRSGIANWAVYHSALGAAGYILLNTTAASTSSSTFWQSTTPTTTSFFIGTNGNVGDSGLTYVAYLFATLAGVSKVGSYTGNGTTQTINCGFTSGARFVLIKRTDSTGGWYVYDTARGMTTVTDPYFFFDTTAAQVATLGSVTTVTTGFAVNASILAAINTNAATYIFLAIA